MLPRIAPPALPERHGAGVLLANVQNGNSLAYNHPYDNLRLGAIGAALRLSRVDVHYFDSAVDQLPLSEKVSMFSASLVVIVDTLYRVSEAVLESIRAIRDARPTARVILVGRAAAALGRRPEIAGLVDDVFDSADVAGIVAYCVGHLSCGNSVIETDWAAITPDRPFRVLSKHRGVLDIEATKGCVSTCSFCAVDGVVGGPRNRTWIARDAVTVVSEIASLTSELGVHKVQFVDDNFLGSPESAQWALAFADEVRRQRLSIRFSCYARLDRVLDEAIDALVSVGLVQVHAGVESGSRTVLRRLRKGTSPEKLAAMIERVRRAGVDLVASLIVFEPRMTSDELRESLLWLKANGLERYFSLTTLIPFEASLSFAELENQRIISTETAEFQRIGYRFADNVVAAAYRTAVQRETDYNQATSGLLDHMMRVRFGHEELLEPPSVAEQSTLRGLDVYRLRQIDAILDDLDGTR